MPLDATHTCLRPHDHFRSVWLMIIGTTWLALNGPAPGVEWLLCLFALLSGGLTTCSASLPPSQAARGEETWLSLNMSAIATLWVLFVVSNG